MPILEVKNLKKSFGASRVLEDISLTMEKGEVLVILGSSGSGKTTLLRCLNSLETPDEGSAAVDGEYIFGGPQGPDSGARFKLGLVFQQFNLFPQYTALGNVELAPNMMAKKLPDYRQHRRDILQRNRAKALELLGEVGLADRADFYPHQLSGGQQQRVAIARALALDPQILCFDEPTSALDPELTGEVLRVIRELKTRGRTMIVVTHELEFARGIADRVIFMDGGVIAEQGAPEQVFGNPSNQRTRAFFSSYRR